VSCDAEQPILKRFAEAGIHGQGDDQSGNASGYANHAEHGDEAQNGRPVGRPKVAFGYEPLEAHASARPL
jgi:hypothetical protein